MLLSRRSFWNIKIIQQQKFCHIGSIRTPSPTYKTSFMIFSIESSASDKKLSIGSLKGK